MTPTTMTHETLVFDSKGM